MYERKTALQINDCTPACTNPLLPAAILCKGLSCPVNEELKLLSDEGRTRALACTLPAFLFHFKSIIQKSGMCANAWLIAGLSCHGADVGILVADARILNAD
jgi:hypothetical protein